MTRRSRGGDIRSAVKFLLLCAALAAPAAGARAGDSFKTAPPLKLPGVDGKPVEVSFRDARATLVNFWATWCLPCRDEMPQISSLFEKYRERGFRAVGVALESGTASEVREFLKQRNLDLAYPILMGDDQVMESYGDVQIVPTTYLIGAGGEVLKTYYGAAPDFEKQVGADLEKILGAAAPEPPKSAAPPAADPPAGG